MIPLRIHLLPIEPFTERYTAQWYEWWRVQLGELGCDVTVYDGDRQFVHERTGGEFLDPVSTWGWKGSQVAALAAAWRRGHVQDGDWVLSLDGYGPASTAVPYMRDTTGVRVRYAAFWHAGAHDPHDFLARRGMGRWSIDVERGWLKAADAVFCCSRSQRAEMSRALALLARDTAKIFPIGNPVMRADLLREAQLDAPTPWHERPPLVVFPHRLAPEKQPQLFRELEQRYRELYPEHPADFHVTREHYTTKRNYYRTLARARVCVSFALQENFGTSMNEAAALGAWGVAPDWKCYPETVQERGTGMLFAPGDLTAAAQCVHRALTAVHAAPWDGYYERTINRAVDVLRGGVRHAD